MCAYVCLHLLSGEVIECAEILRQERERVDGGLSILFLLHMLEENLEEVSRILLLLLTSFFLSYYIFSPLQMTFHQGTPPLHITVVPRTLS